VSVKEVLKLLFSMHHSR